MVNTDTSNLGKSTVIIQGKVTTTFLVADQTFDIRSTTNATLTPDYGNASGPALECFANGDCNVRNNITALGTINSPALQIAGVDVQNQLDARALAVDMLLKANT